MSKQLFVYLQLVPAVTELMVAELLYLEKQGATLPIEMLINSSGTTRQDGEIVSSLLVWQSFHTAEPQQLSACLHVAVTCDSFLPTSATEAGWA